MIHGKKVKLLCAVMIVSVMVFAQLIIPVYANASTVNSNRICGADRYETSAKIAEAGWEATSNYAVIATGECYADSLCAAPLAKKYNAPILLTESDKLNDNAKDELVRLNTKNVFIVGGTGAVSLNTESQIRALGINNISRIAGTDRYDTSEKIADIYFSTSSSAVVATGNNYPDALSIASIAALDGMPILLTDQNGISDKTKSYLNSSVITKTYVIGGNGVVSDKVFGSLKKAERISGNNRYETNTAVLNKFSSNLNLSQVYLATGDDFPDALSCSVLAANTKSPILLICNDVNSSTKTYVNNNINLINNFTAVGGTGVISNSLLKSVTENFVLVYYTHYNYSLDYMVNMQFGANSVFYDNNKRTWVQATKDQIKLYVNPLNYENDSIQKYQFMKLDESYGVPVDQLNSILAGKGILANKGASYEEAAQKNGINELYLIMHSLLETGNGTSKLATGYVYNGTTVYNMYGVGAVDENPDERGAKYAYEHGWTTPEKAIVGGAAFIGTYYIKAGQNTIYKMKWNPANPYNHQYATDVMWAYGQCNILYYNVLQKCRGSIGFKYDIPVFN